MYTKKLSRGLLRLAQGSEGSNVQYSSIGKPCWPSGPYPPPGSVPPKNLYPDIPPDRPSPGYEVPPGYCPPIEDPKCPVHCCTPPGCQPAWCPPVCGDTPPLSKDCRGRRRICPPPCCYPGPVPYNPCCPVFPKANYKKYKALTLCVFFPLIILAALNAFGNEHCPKGPCREYEFMRRRTKRFPWGDGNTSFFHNEHANHLPEECEPPPLICYPDPGPCE